MHPQGARTALGALPGLVILLLLLLVLLVGKGFFPNCTIPMRIHLCKLPSGHVHCIEKERKRIFKYFLWLNKTFLLNSSSRISNANRMQAALSHFSSPLWGFTIWNVFELQLPIVHEVCLFLFPSSSPHSRVQIQLRVCPGLQLRLLISSRAVCPLEMFKT